MLRKAEHETKEAWMTVEPPHLPWMTQPDFLFNKKNLLSCFMHS